MSDLVDPYLAYLVDSYYAGRDVPIDVRRVLDRLRSTPMRDLVATYYAGGDVPYAVRRVFERDDTRTILFRHLTQDWVDALEAGAFREATRVFIDAPPWLRDELRQTTVPDPIATSGGQIIFHKDDDLWLASEAGFRLLHLPWLPPLLNNTPIFGCFKKRLGLLSNPFLLREYAEGSDGPSPMEYRICNLSERRRRHGDLRV